VDALVVGCFVDDGQGGGKAGGGSDKSPLAEAVGTGLLTTRHGDNDKFSWEGVHDVGFGAELPDQM
jgi:hypothetical protein